MKRSCVALRIPFPVLCFDYNTVGICYIKSNLLDIYGVYQLPCCIGYCMFEKAGLILLLSV